MASAKDLTDEQRAQIEQWVSEGAQLPDIQKRLMAEFELNVTYLDTRFLMLDLGLEVQTDAPEGAGEEEASEPAESAVTPEEEDSAPASPGAVAVTVDELARPGALVSGIVTFSDGEKAVWLIDEMGRLGLDPDTPGYQPKEADGESFEKELRRLLDE